jgi:hypothetical protein
MGTSSGCIYLKFYKELLIVAYPDKHCDRVWSINPKNLAATEIYNGDIVGVCIFGSNLFVKDYQKKEIFCLNLENPTASKEFIQEGDVQLKHIEFTNRIGWPL